MINLINDVLPFSNIVPLEDPELLQGLWPSPAVAIGAAVSLVIIFLLLTYFLYFPIKNNIEKRQEKIDQEMKNAAKLNDDAFKLSKAIDKEKKQFQLAKKDLFEKSKKEAEELKRQIIDQANNKVVKIHEDLKAQLEKERKDASADIEKEITVLSTIIAEKIISKNMNSKINDEIIEKALKEIRNNNDSQKS